MRKIKPCCSDSSIAAVLSIIIAITLLEAYRVGDFQFFHITGDLLASFFVSICLGIAGGFVWSLLLNKVRNIKNAMFTTAAFVFVIFGLVEMLGFNGPIAALVFGITLSNLQHVKFSFIRNLIIDNDSGLTDMEKVFFSEIAFLLKTFFLYIWECH
jgi:NhaP-type Na+/H+ or K+/H+ antiporter